MTEPRVALVTGAGRGIGEAVAQRLSAEGYSVALTARSADQLEQVAKGCAGPTLTIPADITAPGAVDEIFAQVEQEWGPVGVLVPNAGTGYSALVERTTDEGWALMLDLNLTAVFRCLRRGIPSMRAAGYGRIVVIASVSSKVGEPYIGAYTASKHGVLGLVRSAASELATAGVTVNAVCPGYVDTPMTDFTIENISKATGRTLDEARHIIEAKQPNGRLITPEEVAESVWFCVVNGGMTGQGINVDGGAFKS